MHKTWTMLQHDGRNHLGLMPLCVLLLVGFKSLQLADSEAVS